MQGPNYFFRSYLKCKEYVLTLTTAGEDKFRKQVSLILSVLILITPLLFVAVFYEVIEYRHDKRVAYARRENVAARGALLVKERMDKVIDVGNSLASRPLVRQYIKAGKWDDAIDDIRNAPSVFPYIEKVIFLDTRGIFMASAPAREALTGKDLSRTDYYQEMIKRWSPSISGVIQDIDGTDCHHISVAVPVRTDLDKQVLGVLVMDIDMESFVNWDTDIDSGPAGYMYLVDKDGIPALHLSEDIAKANALVPFLSVRATSSLKMRVNEWFDPLLNDTQVIASTMVPGYDLGVVVVQPARIVFMEIRGELVRRMALWTALLIFVAVSLYLILRSRRAMREDRDRKEALLEGVGDGIIAIDRRWHITFWNRAASTITGWSKNEVMGKPLRSFLKFIKDVGHTEDYAFIEDAVISGNTTSVTKNSSLVKKDGSEFSIGDSASPIINEHGEAEGAVIVFRDTSKEVESGRLRSDFSYATHQLRTPVTEAVWNLDLAMNESDAEKRKEDLEVVRNSLASVKELTEHLVEVSALDQGNVVPQLSMVKLVDIFAEVQKDIEKKAGSRNITLSLPAISSLEAVNTDPKLLKRALHEIFENAVLYSSHGGTVTVKVGVQGDTLLIEVSNLGAWVPDEEQPIVFTKFFRGSNKGAGSVGSGLGLFIAREYIKLLKGKIWFTSREDGVTTFYVSVPIK